MARLPQPGPASVKPTRPSFPHIRQYHALADNDLMTSGAGRFGNNIATLAQFAMSASTLLGELNTKIIRPELNPGSIKNEGPLDNLIGNPDVRGMYTAGKIFLNEKNDIKKYPLTGSGDPTPEWKSNTVDQKEETLIHEQMHYGFDELRKTYPLGALNEHTGETPPIQKISNTTLLDAGEGEHAVIKGMLLVRGAAVNDKNSRTSMALVNFMEDPSDYAAADIIQSIRVHTSDSKRPGYNDQTNSYLRRAYRTFAAVSNRRDDGTKFNNYDPDLKHIPLDIKYASDQHLLSFLLDLRNSMQILDNLAGDETARLVSERVKQVEANESE